MLSILSGIFIGWTELKGSLDVWGAQGFQEVAVTFKQKYSTHRFIGHLLYFPIRLDVKQVSSKEMFFFQIKEKMVECCFFSKMNQSR